MGHYPKGCSPPRGEPAIRMSNPKLVIRFIMGTWHAETSPGTPARRMASLSNSRTKTSKWNSPGMAIWWGKPSLGQVIKKLHWFSMETSLKLVNHTSSYSNRTFPSEYVWRWDGIWYPESEPLAVGLSTNMFPFSWKTRASPEAMCNWGEKHQLLRLHDHFVAAWHSLWGPTGRRSCQLPIKPHASQSSHVRLLDPALQPRSAFFLKLEGMS